MHDVHRRRPGHRARARTRLVALRIAVLGAGKIGSTFASRLARIGGHDVTVIARTGSVRLKQLERDRAIVDTTGERTSVHVAGVLDEQVAYDLLIVTLLAHQTDALLSTLHRSAAKRIQFMFNTFDPERLQEAVGVERCSFGMPFVRATLDGDGRLEAIVGSGGQKTIMDDRRWVEVFNAAGLPAALEGDMPLWLRCHVPLCVAFESVSVAGERRRGGASWGEALVVARGIDASFNLIKGLGYPIYPAGTKWIDRSPAWAVAAMLWFVSRIPSFRRLLATGEAECRMLVDAMVAAAPLSKLPIRTSRIEAMKPS